MTTDGCICPGRDRSAWYVTHRQHSHSAFNGYRQAKSRYSAVKCERCGRRWRTAAKYVAMLAGYCNYTCVPEGKTP